MRRMVAITGDAVLVVSGDAKRRERAARALGQFEVRQAAELVAALEHVTPPGSIVAVIDAELPDDEVLGLLGALGDPELAVLWVDEPQPELLRSGALVQVPYAADDSILFGVVRRLLKLADLKARLGEPGGGEGRLDRITETVRDVRHAINSPLTAIMAEVELMLMDAEDFNEEQISGLETIGEMARRIRDLVAELNMIEGR